MTRDSLPDFFSSVAKYLVVRCTHSLSVYSSCRLGRKTAPCFDEQHFECPENLFSRLQAIRKMQWEMACDTNNLVCHQATASRNPGTRELSALAFGHVQKNPKHSAQVAPLPLSIQPLPLAPLESSCLLSMRCIGHAAGSHCRGRCIGRHRGRLAALLPRRQESLASKCPYL